MIAAVAGFGVQILADFSGYTDIARGVARMLGFELTINFNRPFLATSTPDFWRRWHISLGSWLGDYVYAPLARIGGSGPLQLSIALMITFTLVGLWHGAAWTFVLQGVWFGVWMVIYTLGSPLVPHRIRTLPGARPLAIAFHLVVVMFPAGLMFREVSMARVLQHISQSPGAFTADELQVAWVAMFVALSLASPMVDRGVGSRDHVFPRLNRPPPAVPAADVGGRPRRGADRPVPSGHQQRLHLLPVLTWLDLGSRPNIVDYNPGCRAR